MSEYPEHDKLRALEDKNQVVGEFIDWLSMKGYIIGAYHKHSKKCYEDGKKVCGISDWDPPLMPVGKSPETLIAEHFGIDKDKIEAEKREILAALRHINQEG